nr:PhoU domain-containing protein [uncultured Clostridium sp.]
MLLEEAITNYLVKPSQFNISDKEQVILASTLHIVIDIERIGEHCNNIHKVLLRIISKVKSYY